MPHRPCKIIKEILPSLCSHLTSGCAKQTCHQMTWEQPKVCIAIPHDVIGPVNATATFSTGEIQVITLASPGVELPIPANATTMQLTVFGPPFLQSPVTNISPGDCFVLGVIPGGLTLTLDPTREACRRFCRLPQPCPIPPNLPIIVIVFPPKKKHRRCVKRRCYWSDEDNDDSDSDSDSDGIDDNID